MTPIDRTTELRTQLQDLFDKVEEVRGFL